VPLLQKPVEIAGFACYLSEAARQNLCLSKDVGTSQTGKRQQTGKNPGLEFNKGHEGHGLGCSAENGLGALTVKIFPSNAFFIRDALF
jgi:hypothetical protein